MQFLTSLFGGEGMTLVSMLMALGIVLVLIVLVAWALKLVFRASGNVGRGRNRRLTLVDALPIDQKRQVIIIRRDNVEHVVMTGGPQDVVIETGIAVEPTPVRVPVRRPPAPNLPKVPQPKVGAPGNAPSVKLPPQGPIVANAAAEKEKAADRQRDDLRFGADLQGQSLRHSGLLRAVSRTEPGVVARFPENSAGSTSDSAKEGWSELSGKGNGGDGKSGGNRGGGRTADGQ